MDSNSPPEGWFNEIAAFLGPAYWSPNTGRVQAFTKGTEQEVEFLVGALELEPGREVLDAGCGPGRHALALARQGVDVLGIDLSEDFIQLARDAASAEALPARFEVGDVRTLRLDGTVDAAICLCQGGFGLLGGPGDVEAFVRIAAAVRPGGRLAVSAFSASFVLRNLEAGDSFDVATGVLHEVATVRDAAGAEREFDLWTTCFTPRELELLATGAGIAVDAVHGVRPGRYRAAAPTVDDHELLLLGRR
ncbi:MAG: class I SAM-dependent methyltransferase [Acidimicrobiia bacterium]